jgi:hypothetical protein
MCMPAPKMPAPVPFVPPPAPVAPPPAAATAATVTQSSATAAVAPPKKAGRNPLRTDSGSYMDQAVAGSGLNIPS